MTLQLETSAVPIRPNRDILGYFTGLSAQTDFIPNSAAAHLVDLHPHKAVL